MANASFGFIDSFAHGYFTITLGRGMYSDTNGSLSVSSTVVRGNSSRSLQCDTTAEEYVQFSWVAGLRITMMAFYIRFQTNVPAEDTTIARFQNANGNGEFGFDASSNRWWVQAGAGTRVESTTEVKANEWYRVVLEYDTNTGTATMRAQVGATGAPLITATNSQSASDITGHILGRIGTISTSRTWHISAWVNSATDGDFETVAAWLSHDVQDMFPNADGTHNIGASGDFGSDTTPTTAFSNATTDGYTYIDHQPFVGTPGADNRIVQLVSGTTNYMEFTFPDLVETVDANIDAVRPIVASVDEGGLGSPNQDVLLLLADGTEVLTTGSVSWLDDSVDAPGTAPTWFRRMAIEPAGDGWTKSRVDGFKARVGFSDGDPDPNFYDMCIEVATHKDVDEGSVSVIITDA